MSSPGITPLGYALLGLIREMPRSGYALRSVFESTPMGNYSSSPGSIYPALEKLRKAKLVEARQPGRGKGLYHLTPAGLKTLETWLRRPTVEPDLSVELLRFAFMQFTEDHDLMRGFLRSFAVTASTQADALRLFLESPAGSALSLHSRISVEHGRRNYEASADWAAWAIESLETQWKRKE